ncbi:MAG TPA: GMC family oxidoreductase N-terminal domain-containing protein, partial [Usitatibacter sp.]|nr:GMC family oxidoreductase N-terminal domain-containing protein [Usitatibacter sp.]
MIADPIRAGLASGWSVIDASTLAKDLDLEADVVVIGSGAGGGVTAEILARAGLKVAIVEEGPLASSSDFRMREQQAYTRLYQESAGRQTLDRGITVLQGRCVGGSTTVSWTAAFRAPRDTLGHWRDVLGLKTMGEAELEPWYRRAEERLSIAPWRTAPNRNNDALRIGCDKLGIPNGLMRRDVKACANLGYCGLGCPTNAKQSMLVTTIPAALERGATLLHGARVTRLALERDRVAWCEAVPAAAPDNRRIRLRARHYVLAAGGIGSPAILLRSEAPDPAGRLGRRTFLHPTVVSAALMRDPVEGFYGAPQSVYSDHFLHSPLDGPAGFKIEAAPVHPVLVGTALPGFGEEHARWMTRFGNVHVAIALLRDGFHPEAPGGAVSLRSDGSPVLDYPMTPYLWQAARRAWLAMAEIQFAAGALAVRPAHESAVDAASWQEA